MKNRLNYIINRVREFANERNLIWKIDDNSCIDCIGVDVIFTSKDYDRRTRYTISYDDLTGGNWRISIDARLKIIFDYVIRDFGLDLEPRSKIHYNSFAEVVNYDYSRYFRTPNIENVIFNDPATIVFWNDGTKTIVKAQDGDVFDPEKGLAMAISKKALGNKGNYYETFKKWLPEEAQFEIEDSLKKIREALSEFEIEDSLKKIREALSVFKNERKE